MSESVPVTVTVQIEMADLVHLIFPHLVSHRTSDSESKSGCLYNTIVAIHHHNYHAVTSSTVLITYVR
jgi:hypothetical protein